MENPQFAFGHITWWGFSPAVDIQEVASANTSDDYHILLVGSGDLRHTLMTIARRYRHSKRKLHFYLIENSYELLARHLLQLLISLEPESRIGLQDKTELYLEVLGNVLVREQVMDYVQNMSTMLIRMITDFDFAATVVPCLKLESLKFKERDFLEAIFKFWRSRETKDFDGPLCWDGRLRQHLGARYDGIPNIFDWDYNMKLTERGAEIINGKLYSQWRHHGVAFELREATYEVTNRTLASGMVSKDSQGNRVAKRGYFGDILVSPFLCFGIGSENSAILEKKNNVYVRNGALVSEYNVLSLFYELANQKRYEAGQEWIDGTQAAETCTIQEVDEEALSTEAANMSLSADGETKKSPLELPFEALKMEDVSVTVLSVGALQELHKKAKYQKLFTHLYFSNSMVHLMNQEKDGLGKILADRSVIMVESALFMLELKIEQVEMYSEKVTEMAKALGHQIRGKLDHKKDTIFVFDRR